MFDLMSALRTAALTDPGVTALTSDRIYVNRIEREVIEGEDPFHPSKMLVLRQAGGGQKLDSTPLASTFVTVLAYGENDYEADRVRRATAQWLNGLTRLCDGTGPMIHDVTVVGGPIPLVDPDITWPGVAQSFSVLAAIYEED